jgi:4-hydroxy-3-methylbut-2-enyl diphosphate reductase IspH
MPPTDGAKGTAAATASALQNCPATKSDSQTLKRAGGRAQALAVIGSIPKSSSSQLRVAVSEWRGERKLEIRETTRIVGETFFPAGAGITLDLDKVPELIELLRRAQR